MKYINDIVDVDISITNPVASTDSFSNLCIIAPAATGAATATKEMPDCLAISDIENLTDYGYAAKDPGYDAVSLAFSQNPRPERVYLAVLEDGEAIADCLTRAAAGDEWWAFAFAGVDSSKYQDASTWAETNHKLFGFNYSTDDLPFAIEDKDYTFALYDGQTGDETESTGNKYAAVAFLAKCFGYEPGQETWEFKSLANVTPSKGLTREQINKFNEQNIVYYLRVARRNITRNAKVGSGEWIDVVRLKDYLITEVQSAVYDFLTTNVKVPYNDDGITGVKNAVNGVLSRAQKNGGIDADIYNDDGTIDLGYAVSVPKAQNISKLDKKERKLYGVEFTARLAGAIHFVRIRGTLVYGGTD